MATAMPAFMSKTPGPVARPSFVAQGISPRVPSGPDRVVMAEEERSPLALAHAREHRFAARRTGPRLGAHARRAQALDHEPGEGGHGGGIVGGALAHDQGLEAGQAGGRSRNAGRAARPPARPVPARPRSTWRRS